MCSMLTKRPNRSRSQHRKSKLNIIFVCLSSSTFSFLILEFIFDSRTKLADDGDAASSSQKSAKRRLDDDDDKEEELTSKSNAVEQGEDDNPNKRFHEEEFDDWR